MENEKKLDKYKDQFDSAWKEFGNNNLGKAEVICKALVIEFPDLLGPYYLLGHIYSDQEKIQKALEQYSVALEKDIERKSGGHIHYWIGQLYGTYMVSGERNLLYSEADAKQHYLKAKEYETYPSEVIYKLRYHNSSDYETIKFFEEAVLKFPDEVPFYIDLSKLYQRQNNNEKAIEILNDALTRKLKSPSLYYNVGVYHFTNDQFSKSRTFFTEALALNVEYTYSNYAVNYAIANSYYKEGDLKNAEAYYRKSFEGVINEDTYWFGFFGLLLIFMEQEKIKEIVKLINEIIIDKSIFFEDGLYYGGGPFWLDSQITESLEHFHDDKRMFTLFKSLKFLEKNDIFLGKTWLIKALLAKQVGNNNARFIAIKNALKHLPSYKYRFIEEELCSIYHDLIDQKNEKHQEINPIIKSFKSDLENYSSFFITRAAESLSNIFEILFQKKLYEDIVKIASYFTDDQIGNDWFKVGYSLNETLDHKKAKGAYETHIRLNGESGASLNNLANIYKDGGNLEKAIELYNRSIKLEPNSEMYNRNLTNTLRQFETVEIEKKHKKMLNDNFKQSLKSIKQENDFVLEKLHKFIFNIKRDEKFKDGEIPIQKYKFPMLMETDKQKAESLRSQWLKKNYIVESDVRDEHNVAVYFINPYLEIEISKINNNKLPENWIKGYENISIDELERIGYFGIIDRIRKTNKKFRPLLERDFNELIFNYMVQNEKATIILSGSLVELALVYYCDKKKITRISYVVPNGNSQTKKLYDCVLNDLILYAEENHFFDSDFRHLSNLSRIYRNFIHPGRELKDKLDKAKCDLCFISTTEILKKIL